MTTTTSAPTTTPTPTTTPAPLLTPAAIFAAVIRPRATLLGFTVYVNHMQDQPDRAILVMDAKGGRLNGRSMRGNHTAFDLVEVQVRSNDHVEAGNFLPAVWNTILKNVTATSVNGKIVQCITKANTMGCMGQEPQTRRWRFVQSFLVNIT
jgi:hypothetical protein